MNITSFTHYLIKEVIKPGDRAVDATAGNGNDTLFLAQQVGKDGKVFAFDIQKQAIQNTYDLIINNNFLETVKLWSCGHENMQQKVKEPVKVVMFNLGYLPKGDHSLITLPETTVKGIEQAINLLQPGGLITITVYTGHEGGKEEGYAVEKLVGELDKKNWDVLKWSFLNRMTAPYLIVLARREV